MTDKEYEQPKKSYTGWIIAGVVIFAIIVIYLFVNSGTTPTETNTDTNTPIDKCANTVCTMEGKECSEGVCVCKSGLIETTDKTKCVECLTDSGCKNNFECTENKCTEKVTGNVTEESKTYISTVLWSDNRYYGQSIDKSFTDSQTDDYLWDGTIRFNGGQDINTHEEFKVSDNVKLETSIKDHNLKTKPYLVASEGDIQYLYVFDNEILLDDVSSDISINIKFLGKDMEISKATENCITYISGDKRVMKVGDSIIVNGKKVELMNIGESGSIIVAVDGSAGIIRDGQTQTINGLQITNDDIFYDTVKQDRTAWLIVGEKSSKKVCDAEDYTDDKYRWIIENPSSKMGKIGIENNVDYNDLDDENTPLSEGDCIDLPNNFLSLCLSKVNSIDYIKYEGKMDGNYLEVRADDENGFVFGTDNKNKVLINESGIFDTNYNYLTNKVYLGESNFFLQNGTTISFDNIVFTLDYLNSNFLNMTIDGTQMTSEEDDIMNYDGLIIFEPNDKYKNNEFTIKVPNEDRPDVVVSLKGAE